MSQPVDLLTLLRLLDGRVTPSEGTTLRELIVTNADVRRRWQLLWQASQGEAESNVTAEATGPTNGQPDGVSSELLAALVEGSLEPAEAAAVERECWRSPILLAEALSAFRFLNGPVEKPVVPPSLTARLLKIGANPEVPSVPASGEFVMTLEEIAATQTSSLPSHHRRSRASRFAIAAVVLLIAGVAVVTWLRSGRDDPQPGSGAGNIAQQPKPKPSDDGTEPRSPEPVTPPPREPQQPIVVQTPPGSNDKKPDDPVVSTPIPNPKPNEPPTTPTEPRSVAQLAWSDIRGLVVRSRAADTPWQAAADTIRLDQPARLATLPESWALGKLGGAIELVLAADTEVVFTATADSPPTLDLALSRGRVALREVPADTPIRFQIGSIQFELITADRNTSLGVEWHANAPRLAVRTGQIKLNGKSVRAGRQVVWTDAGFGPAQPTKGNVAWMQRPDVTTKVPANLLASLKASDDVFATLSELRTDSKTASETRLITSRWSLALNPGDTVWESLNSPLETVRVQTIETIVRMMDHDPRMPQVVRAMTAAINDQQTTSDMHRWFQFAARGERLLAADAWSMVDSLNHSELAVRQISATFLERGIGMRMPGYNPTDAPRARMQGIQQWSQVVNQRFGPRQVPRRRVP